MEPLLHFIKAEAFDGHFLLVSIFGRIQEVFSIEGLAWMVLIAAVPSS
jgi:hypothetical protein